MMASCCEGGSDVAGEADEALFKEASTREAIEVGQETLCCTQLHRVTSTCSATVGRVIIGCPEQGRTGSSVHTFCRTFVVASPGTAMGCFTFSADSKDGKWLCWKSLAGAKSLEV